MSPQAKSAPTHVSRRRPHAKTRTGCRVCKTRKVKCGEERPSCKNCLRRQLRCDFDTGVAVSPGSHEGSEGSVSNLHKRLSDETSLAGGWITALDLELLHHFTTSTCYTLSSNQMIRDFWRVDLPQMGFSHHYLLRGILSLAALHLSCSRVSQRDVLVERALVHHNASLSVAMPMIAAIGPYMPLPLIQFSILTSYIAFATPKQPHNLLIVSDGVTPDWLLLFRGVRNFIEHDGGALQASSLDMMHRSGILMSAEWNACVDAEHDAIDELDDRIRSYFPDKRKADILLGGTDALKRSFKLFRDKAGDDDSRVRCLTMWIFKIDEDFVGLLRSNDYGALCVLGFFCVLLARLDHKWWIRGCGVHLIQRIYSTLDAGHRLWIRWPIEEIGWAP